METGVLRRMLKRAKVWNAISEDVKALTEQHGAVGKVLRPISSASCLRPPQAGRNGWWRIARRCSLFRPRVAA
jgi:hypothetical protein